MRSATGGEGTIATADIEGKELALIVVDMQNKFTGGALRAPAERIVPTINGAISVFRKADRPIVLIKMDGEGHGTGGIEDPDGFVTGLRMEPSDPIVHKTEMNAFCGTGLGKMLCDQGVDGAVICGLVAKWCVHATYFGAYDNGICPYLLRGGTASSDPKDTAMVEALCKTVGPEDIARNRAFRGLDSFTFRPYPEA